MSGRRLLNILDQGALRRIHEASLDLLGEIGVKIEDPAIRGDLRDLGCAVEGDRVKFAPDLVERATDRARLHGEITFTSRTGKTTTVNAGSLLSHTTGGMPSILDLDTGRKRKATLADVVAATRLMNELDQLDFPCAMLYPADVPDRISQVKQTEYLLRYSVKPVSGPGVSSPGEAKYIVELFKAFAGTDRSLREKPIGVLGISPECPLYYPKEITDTMKVIISAGIPTEMLVAPIAGISAPLTIAGGLTQMNASMLAFATIASLINPDTPLIYGARLSFPNMKTGHSIWGLPDLGIAAACSVQLARYYGFISDVYGLGCTACTFDNQAGYEKAINGLLPVIAGANFISGFGGLASLSVASYEQLVIDDETFRALRKVARGVEVNEDTLALRVIADVAGGGSYLAQEHTVRHLRGGELFIPLLGFDGLWNEWESGGQTSIEHRARERVLKVLLDYQDEPLPPALDREIQGIIAAASAELVS